MAKLIQDMYGNTYSSIEELCSKYGISIGMFYKRKKQGWALEQILLTPRKNPCKESEDHLGNKYESETEMCRAYHISTGIYNSRRRSNWSVEQALTTPVRKKARPVKDYNGVQYPSTADMCRAYSINMRTFIRRRDNGWTLKDALTGNPEKKTSYIYKPKTPAERHPEKIGETRLMNCGLSATITKYENCNDIDVCFENGEKVEHVQYARFKRGQVKIPKI